MKQKLARILRETGDSSPVTDVRRVSGGDISEAYRVKTSEGTYFVKYNENVPDDFFQKEAEGLRLLKETGALRVPDVYGYSHGRSPVQGFIVLEWIEGRTSRHTEEQLGRGLASLHRSHHDCYGLEADNYIGRLPQPNGWFNDWVDFFREKRLGAQVQLAEERGALPPSRRDKLDRLLASLERWLPRYGQPSLLHGDLWSGNWIAGPGGEPYLIDPAVFYGEREFELAFTELFGGFSPRFYEAYNEVSPLSGSYEERKPLYQLYYLLVHLTLFGETYGPSVDRVLAYYVG